ncbi:MAG: DUF309 domain-containing protein [Rhodobacteraceae bacterium]|nr:MAG: DUF309 domain-containing protein [Paracoccaceae bacterium]
MGQDIWPTRPYVPGKTARHPDGAFDAVRQTAKAGLSPAELSTCQAFRLGRRYIETGYYWEAHELLEPVWMALPDPSAERRFVQALIQIANGFLKLKMDRPRAARRLEAISRKLLAGTCGASIMGVDSDEIRGLLARLGHKIDMQDNASFDTISEDAP